MSDKSMVCQSFLVYLTKGHPFQQENRLDPTLWTNLNICFQMATLVCNFACRFDRSTILCKFKICFNWRKVWVATCCLRRNLWSMKVDLFTRTTRTTAPFCVTIWCKYWQTFIVTTRSYYTTYEIEIDQHHWHQSENWCRQCFPFWVVFP